MRLSIIIFLFSVSVFAQKTYQKTFYNNGKIKEEGWIKDNKKEDYWKFYYSNGILQQEGHFSEGKQVNYWHLYNKNGNKEMEGNYINGAKYYWWIFYNDLELINYKCQLKNDLKNGFCLQYKENEIVMVEKYQFGKKIKEWTDLKSFREENSIIDINANN